MQGTKEHRVESKLVKRQHVLLCGMRSTCPYKPSLPGCVWHVKILCRSCRTAGIAGIKCRPPRPHSLIATTIYDKQEGLAAGQRCAQGRGGWQHFQPQEQPNFGMHQHSQAATAINNCSSLRWAGRWPPFYAPGTAFPSPATCV